MWFKYALTHCEEGCSYSSPRSLTAEDTEGAHWVHTILKVSQNQTKTCIFVLVTKGGLSHSFTENWKSRVDLKQGPVKIGTEE